MNKLIIKTDLLGPVGIIWEKNGPSPLIKQILISRPGISAELQARQFFYGAKNSSCPQIDSVAKAIQQLLKGCDLMIPLDLVDLDSGTKFQKSVLMTEYRIPRGKVSSYGLIARHLEKPGGARAVGGALAHNPFPLIIPCHRAIRSDRTLGGFQGGLKMKRSLLELEGIHFDRNGKVREEHFHTL